MRRRDFIYTAGSLAAASLLPGGMYAASEKDGPFCFSEPFDGAILHERFGSPVLGVTKNRDGKQVLRVAVSGSAPKNIAVEVISPCGNSVPVQRSGNRFSAEVFLTGDFNEVKATATIDGQKKTIVTRPAWLKKSFKRFQFQIDDNSFFLRDIYDKDYKDIFDCFYLAGLRKLHVKYGARFAVNCFWSTPKEDFNMGMMPDKYKSQWEANADWLRLTFHAKNEFPDRPYENATPEQLAADFDLVKKELVRFAGNAYSPPGIVHWGTVRPETLPVLKERGVRALSGYFTKSSGNWIVHFQLPDAVCEYLSNHDSWYDYKTGLIFSKLELVCNSVPLPKILPTLESSAANPNTAELMDFLTHEQYFWPWYANYLPDHFQRLDTTIRYAVEHGYKPVWHHETVF